jgi:DNA-binding ferritin-like protein (Dps family)
MLGKPVRVHEAIAAISESKQAVKYVQTMRLYLLRKKFTCKTKYICEYMWKQGFNMLLRVFNMLEHVLNMLTPCFHMYSRVYFVSHVNISREG